MENTKTWADFNRRGSEKRLKFTALLTIAVMLLALPANTLAASGGTSVGAKPSMSTDSVVEPKIEPYWKEGEKLTFKIGWGFVTAGRTYMETIPYTTDSGKENLHFRWVTKSSEGFDSFYKVRDTINTWAVKETLLPHAFSKIINEGSWHNRSHIRFDHIRSEAALTDTVFTVKDGKWSVKRHKDTSVFVYPGTHCIVSAFYHIRSLDLQPGKTFYFYAVSGKKRYDLKVVCHKRETIETEAGKFKTIVVQPFMADDGVFKGNGELKIWLTDDEQKIPVLMKSKIAVGSIFAELIEAN